MKLPLSPPVFAPADARAGQIAQNSQPGQNGQSRPLHDGEEMKRRAAMARDVSATLGQIVSLMMRSRTHRFNMMIDLEWMVVPAIATRQFRVAEGVSAEAGVVAPIAAVIWASVSAEVDQRLAQNIDAPVRLKPEEWRSGDIVWVVDILGDPKAVDAILQHLKQNELKDRRVRMRVKGENGKATIGRVELQAEPAAG